MSFLDPLKLQTCFVIKMSDILISSKLTFSPYRNNMTSKNLGSVSIFVIKGPTCSIHKSSLHSVWKKRCINIINKKKVPVPDSTGLHNAIYIWSDRWIWQGMENMERITSSFIFVGKLKDLGGEGVKGNRKLWKMYSSFLETLD